VWTVAFSPDGQTLAAGMGPSVWLWDPAARRIRAMFKVPHNIRIVAFAPDGKTLVTVGAVTNPATGQVEGVGQLFDLASLQPKATVRSHGQRIVGVSFSSDGRLLSTASNSAPEVRLWDISKVRPPSVPVVAAAPALRRNVNPVAAAAPSRLAQLPPAGLPVAGSPP
jgi:WD40 repeat protein